VRYITRQAWNLNGCGRCERALAGSARGFRTSSLLTLHWREPDSNSRLPPNRKNADGVRTFRAAGIVLKKELAFRACVIEITLKVNARQIKGMEMRAIRGYVAAALPALALFTSYASAKGTNSTDVIIRLRLAGDVAALPLIRSCLAKKLSQMPDVKVATASTEGARFVVDIVAAKNTNKKVSASLVVAEIFPMEQFQPRMKEGENAEALLTSIQYYTLLRMHEVIPARSDEALCLSIAADIGDQVLSKEYTERND